MTKFQIVLWFIFGIFAIGGVVAFATYRSSSVKSELPPVVIWGVLDRDVVERYLSSDQIKEQKLEITYVELNPSNFGAQFTNALALGRAPDLILIPHDFVFREREKIMFIPGDSLPERDFKDQFIGGAEVLLGRGGAAGIPIAIDPLVMYWNRNHFKNANVTLPPKFWDEFYNLVPKLVKKDQAGNLLQAGVPFGEWVNVTNAKEILSTLFIQAGTPITALGQNGLLSVLNQQFGYPLMPAEAALRFFTEFSDRAKSSFSWSKAMPKSRDAFISEKLSIYFGLASELQIIRQSNPNLNFDVAVMPQARDGNQSTFARVYLLAIPAKHPNPSVPFAVAGILTSPANVQNFSDISLLPPARRDLLSATPKEAYKANFYKSAVIGSSWLDPNPDLSAGVFKEMVESVISGRQSISSAVSRANSELQAIISGR